MGRGPIGNNDFNITRLPANTQTKNAQRRPGSVIERDMNPDVFSFGMFEVTDNGDGTMGLSLIDDWDFTCDSIEQNAADIDAAELRLDDLEDYDDWHNIGEAGEPAFQNGWVNYNYSAGVYTTYDRAGFYKDKEGFVHLKGLIKSGTLNTSAFTLPSGYRPQYRNIMCVISNGVIGRVDILNSGSVFIHSTSSSSWVSLSGIVIKADAV